ncbi:hypothetical protein [Streptomyces echinatus]|uniref:hypothetical protein n=1 Tax=Streptomyces echinatus TaxID=67293 RepID=UPI003797DF9E
MTDHDRERQDETTTAAGRAAPRPRGAERERGADDRFGHPCPERVPGARTRRRVSEAAAVADCPPGVVGGYGTTGGVRPAATGAARPPAHDRRTTPSGPPSAEPGGDAEEGPLNRPER